MRRQMVKIALLLLGSMCVLAAENRAPLLEPVDSRAAEYGKKISFYLRASDPDNDQIFFSADNLPPGAVLHADTGFFSWTPRLADLGNHRVVFFATDDGSPALSASRECSLRAVFRTMSYAKGWGLGLRKQIITETDSAAALRPAVIGIKLGNVLISASPETVVVPRGFRAMVSVASIYHIDGDRLSSLLDGEEIEVDKYSNVESIGSNIVGLDIEFVIEDLRPGRHRLAISAANEAGESKREVEFIVK